MQVYRGFAISADALNIIKYFQVVIAIHMKVINTYGVKFFHQLFKGLGFVGVYGSGYLQFEGAKIQNNWLLLAKYKKVKCRVIMLA
jgi:hypothetical protein